MALLSIIAFMMVWGSWSERLLVGFANEKASGDAGAPVVAEKEDGSQRTVLVTFGKMACL
jgi:hypothetical protein